MPLLRRLLADELAPGPAPTSGLAIAGLALEGFGNSDCIGGGFETFKEQAGRATPEMLVCGGIGEVIGGGDLAR